VTLVYNPTIFGTEVFSDPVQMKRAGITRTDTPLVTAAIALLQRYWDNGVATRELRSRLRGHWELPVVWTVLGFAVIASLILFHPGLAPWPIAFGGWVSFLLMGPARDAVSTTAAGILGCWYLGLFITAFGSAFSTTGAFYAETQKSTLGFLLSTPLSTRSIVLGKAFGLLGPSLGVLTALSAWTLALTICFLPLLGPAALLGWIYAVLTALTFYLAVNAITFSVSAMFPKLSMSGSAWIWVLIFWFVGLPLGGVYAAISAMLVVVGLRGAAVWLVFIAMAWIMISLAYSISVSSIHSLRRRDLGFASTKRNN
jgi:hypothetical protein